MPLNCGGGEDSWESLGLQGDQTSWLQRKSTLNIHWKDWCWSWSSNTLATCYKEMTHWKRLTLRKVEGKSRQERQRMIWLDSIADSMDMNLSKFWEIVKDRGAWHAAVQGVAKNQIWLSKWTTTTNKGISKIKIEDAKLPEHSLAIVWFDLLSSQIRTWQAIKFNHFLHSIEI